MRYFVWFCYDGTNYHGWQVQPNGITVQSELERCLSLLLREQIQVTGAGRTDAGVHARQMAAHFDTDAVFNVVNVNISNDNNRLIVGTIPCVVKIAQQLRRKTVDDFDFAYHIVMPVFCARENDRICFLSNSPFGGLTQPPFLMNYTSLFLYLLIGKKQPMRQVLEDQQARVDGTLSGVRNIVHVEKGGVDCGEGIDIHNAYRLKVIID